MWRCSSSTIACTASPVRHVSGCGCGALQTCSMGRLQTLHASPRESAGSSRPYVRLCLATRMAALLQRSSLVNEAVIGKSMAIRDIQYYPTRAFAGISGRAKGATA